ncbi:MAG: hypothetical protein ACK5AL_11005 [Planctomycetota bacterium]|jgi:hypothetical protein
MKRAAVVALGVLAGLAAQRWLGVDGGAVIGLCLGVLAANFVPLPSCGGDDAAG